MAFWPGAPFFFFQPPLQKCVFYAPTLQSRQHDAVLEAVLLSLMVSVERYGAVIPHHILGDVFYVYIPLRTQRSRWKKNVHVDLGE